MCIEHHNIQTCNVSTASINSCSTSFHYQDTFINQKLPYKHVAHIQQLHSTMDSLFLSCRKVALVHATRTTHVRIWAIDVLSNTGAALVIYFADGRVAMLANPGCLAIISQFTCILLADPAATNHRYSFLALLCLCVCWIPKVMAFRVHHSLEIFTSLS